MTEPKAERFGVSEGNAQVVFDDGSLLALVPYRNNGRIEDFNVALLYQGKGLDLEALARVRPSRYARPEERGFWSRGRISQSELAGYLAATRMVADGAYLEYREGKISQEEWGRKFWEFWVISLEIGLLRDSLKDERERVFDRNPGYRESRLIF